MGQRAIDRCATINGGKSNNQLLPLAQRKPRWFLKGDLRTTENY